MGNSSILNVTVVNRAGLQTMASAVALFGCCGRLGRSQPEVPGDVITVARRLTSATDQYLSRKFFSVLRH
jgi:hypothetical protein